jgi:hypothetical protein
MINLRLNYLVLQTINIVFFFLAYLFLRHHFDLRNSEKLIQFVILLPLVISGAYVFYTNRIFYILAEKR